MRACGCSAMRLAGLFGIALAMLLPRPVAAATLPKKSETKQIVLLLPGRSLLEQRLPRFIQARPGQYVAASTLQRACATLMPSADSLLLFLPDSQHCEKVTVREQIVLRQRLRQLTGRWPTEDPLVRLGKKPFLVMAPAPRQTAPLKTACTCANTPPDGVTMCTAQTRTAGKPIATVEYLATDADGDPLAGTFSYQYDSDPVQAGLPSPLTSSCTPAAGSLQCKIDGNAPAQSGSLQLMLKVSDGIATPDLHLMSLLQVLATSDRIFVGSFEDPATLSCAP